MIGNNLNTKIEGKDSVIRQIVSFFRKIGSSIKNFWRFLFSKKEGDLLSSNSKPFSEQSEYLRQQSPSKENQKSPEASLSGQQSVAPKLDANDATKPKAPSTYSNSQSEDQQQSAANKEDVIEEYIRTKGYKRYKRLCATETPRIIGLISIKVKRQQLKAKKRPLGPTQDTEQSSGMTNIDNRKPIIHTQVEIQIPSKENENLSQGVQTTNVPVSTNSQAAQSSSQSNSKGDAMKIKLEQLKIKQQAKEKTREMQLAAKKASQLHVSRLEARFPLQVNSTHTSLQILYIQGLRFILQIDLNKKGAIEILRDFLSTNYSTTQRSVLPIKKPGSQKMICDSSRSQALTHDTTPTEETKKCLEDAMQEDHPQASLPQEEIDANHNEQPASLSEATAGGFDVLKGIIVEENLAPSSEVLDPNSSTGFAGFIPPI